LNDKALSLLAQVDLETCAGLMAVELSYGRERALEIATTLAMDPRLMLLDPACWSSSTTSTAWA